MPASINLIKQLEKNDDLPFINQVVDIYNIISLDTKLALGAHDMDRVDGNVILRFSNARNATCRWDRRIPSRGPT